MIFLEKCHCCVQHIPKPTLNPVFRFFGVFRGSGNHLGTQSSAKSWVRPIENLKVQILEATPVWGGNLDFTDKALGQIVLCSSLASGLQGRNFESPRWISGIPDSLPTLRPLFTLFLTTFPKNSAGGTLIS